MATSPAEHPSAQPFVPETRSLRTLSEAAAACRGCALFEHATQTVFGNGRRNAVVVLVGEQPGDVEDRKGRCFVGPAGRVLWRCVEEAAIPREAIYVTNAVKHFKFEQRGKRRIHQRPSAAEIDACLPWLSAELAILRPPVIVALGTVALRSLLGRPLTIDAAREQELTLGDAHLVATYHPSAVLRADDPPPIEAALTEDLRRSWQLARREGGGARANAAAS
ncbi:UdgX family uracil-DNA binding protein [Desertimonas flava]|jgi:DNA polymerase|uniref:UdgX family uracil-DNA binding protein n=1 Tax=Desertimonas flava TaxID=2064846 RepID=UPI000E3547B8|nr:UdgX family uracil-DNA binding protein [Desertimonas flava]